MACARWIAGLTRHTPMKWGHMTQGRPDMTPCKASSVRALIESSTLCVQNACENAAQKRQAAAGRFDTPLPHSLPVSRLAAAVCVSLPCDCILMAI